MKLGVFDRLILLNILPKEGDFTTIKQVREMREDLSFTDEELELLKFKQNEDGTMQWKNNVVGERDINFKPTANSMIVDTLKKLSDDKKLTEQHYELYNKFVGE